MTAVAFTPAPREASIASSRTARGDSSTDPTRLAPAKNAPGRSDSSGAPNRGADATSLAGHLELVADSPRKAADATVTPAGSLLLLLGENLDDLEGARIAFENRYRSLIEAKGMDGTDPLIARTRALGDQLAALEHQAELELKRALRTHPLGAWVKNTPGVGEKQGARLLAALGDPAWNDLHGRPRKLRELYAYAGFHVVTPDGTQWMNGDHRGPGVAPARRRGQHANWNPTVRSRVWLIAEACMKCVGSDTRRRSPYRDVYDAARIKYADATHSVECKRCGPSGKPALVGSELSDGHKHARALRLVAKALLRDLWHEAHNAVDRQPSCGFVPDLSTDPPKPMPQASPAAAGPLDSPDPPKTCSSAKTGTAESEDLS